MLLGAVTVLALASTFTRDADNRIHVEELGPALVASGSKHVFSCFLCWARFCRKKVEVIPIPPAVREVMYRYHWDKLLVDVRRAVDITTKGACRVSSRGSVVGEVGSLTVEHCSLTTAVLLQLTSRSWTPSVPY